MSIILRDPNFLTAPSPGLYTGEAAVLEYNNLIFNDRRAADMIRVMKITGLDDPDVRDSREENPDRDGETAFDALYGGRTITLQGEITAGSFNRLEALYGQLKDAFDELTEKPLKFRWLDWYDDFAPSNALVDYTIDVGAGGFSVASDRSGLQPSDLTNKQFWLAPAKYTYGDSEDVVGVAQRAPVSQFGPILRRASANQFLYVKYEPSNGRVALYKRVAGVDTLLDNVAVSLPSPTGNLISNWSVETDLSNWTLSNYIRTNLVTNPSAEYGLTGWTASVPTRTNLVTNPSLENASAGTAGWSVAAVSGGNNAATSIARVTSASVVGTAAGEITANAANDFSGAYISLAGLVAGQTYQASLWVRSAASTAQVVMSFGLSLADRGVSATINLATGWQKLTATWTAAGSGTGFIAIMRSITGTADVFQVDAVQVTQSSAVLPYFDGDTPGYGWTGVPHASTSSNTATVTNLCPRPRFEDASTSGWAVGAVANYGDSGGAAISTTTGGYFGGTCMQVVTGAVASTQGTRIVCNGTFKQGVTYNLTIRLKGAGTTQLYVQLREAVTGADAVTLNPTLTTGWVEYRLAWTPSADRTNAIINLLGNVVGTNQTFFVDAAALFASVNNAGYFDGTFPGASWTGTAYASTSTRSAAGLVQNLVTNGDFEANTTGWATSDAQWLGSAGATITRDTGTKRSGAASGKIVTTAGSAQQGVVIKPAATIASGTTATVSVWMRGNVGGEVVRLVFGPGNTSHGFVSRTAITLTTTFTQYTLTFTTTATDSNWAIATMVDAGSVAQTWFIDDVELIYGSNPSAGATGSQSTAFTGATIGAWWMGRADSTQTNSVLPVLTQSSAWASSGSKSFRLVQTINTGETYSITSPTMAVTAALTYAAQMAANVSAIGSTATVRIHWSTGASTTIQAVSATGIAAWSTTAAAPGGATSAYIEIIPTSTGLIDMYFDAVALTQSNVVPAFFDGDTVGAAWTGTPGSSTSTQPFASLVRSTAWSAVGAYSARLQATLTGSEAPILDMPSFVAVAGAMVTGRLSAHAATLSGGASLPLKIRWSDGTDSAVFATLSAVGDSSPSFSVTVPAGVTSGTIRAAPTAAGTYDVSFDAVVVVAGSSIPYTTYYVSARADGSAITYGIWNTVPDDFGTPLTSKTFTLSTGDQTTFPNTGTNTHGVYWTPGGTAERLVFYDVAALNPGDAQITCRKFAKIEAEDAYDSGQYKRTFMISLRSSSGKILSRKFKIISLVPTIYALTFPGDGSGLTFPADGSGLIFGGVLGTPVNLGRAPANVIVRMYGPMPNPALANQTNDTRLGINGTIADGDYYEFDTLERTVVDSLGVDQYDKITDDTNWLELAKGTNSLLVGADSIGAHSLVQLLFQHSSR